MKVIELSTLSLIAISLFYILVRNSNTVVTQYLEPSTFERFSYSNFFFKSRSCCYKTIGPESSNIPTFRSYFLFPWAFVFVRFDWTYIYIKRPMLHSSTWCHLEKLKSWKTHFSDTGSFSLKVTLHVVALCGLQFKRYIMSTQQFKDINIAYVQYYRNNFARFVIPWTIEVHYRFTKHKLNPDSKPAWYNFTHINYSAISTCYTRCRFFIANMS